LVRLGQRIGRARIGEEQDAEVEASFFGGESRVVELALALLGGEIGFDDVGVGDFASILQLVGEVDESSGFVEGALRNVDFAAMERTEKYAATTRETRSRRALSRSATD